MKIPVGCRDRCLHQRICLGGTSEKTNYGNVMEIRGHLGEKLDHWRLVGVLLAELEGQLKGAILKGSLVGTEDHSVPQHNVVLPWSSRHPSRRVLLLEQEIEQQLCLN